MKVAIIHDWITNFGGGEQVLLKLHNIFPDAPIYTLVYNKKKMEKYFRGIDIRTSFIQNIPYGIKFYKMFLPYMPIAFEQFDLSEYDLVISSSSCCAKGVNVNSKTTHICYCHTPMRYAWDMYLEYNSGMSKIKKFIIANMMNKLRIWDRISADRVDTFIANSNYVATRIKKNYRRDSVVVYPPVDTTFYNIDENQKIGDYYLVASRLVKYKKIDLLIKAFNKLPYKLIIIGDGPEENRLKKLAKSNIEFKGYLEKEQMREYYKKCKAFIFMADEDFGIVTVEVQSCGRPVIALKKGGSLEIVIDNETGYLVDRQDVDEIVKIVEKMEENYLNFDCNKIRKNAERFGVKRFEDEIRNLISM